MTAQKGHKNAPPERPFFRIACSPVLEIRQQAAQRAPSAALPVIARHCDVQGVRLTPRFARALHLGLFALPDPCLPAVLPDHSLPVSGPFGSCQPGVALTGRAQGGTACFCIFPVCWPSQDAKTGTLWTRRVATTRAATANQKPRRAVVCGPQFQASGRLKRTALGAAFAPLFAVKKWQKKLVYMVRIMSSDAVCVEPFRPLQRDIRVSADNLPFRGCETAVISKSNGAVQAPLFFMNILPAGSQVKRASRKPGTFRSDQSQIR
ncbi:hypothetical protein Selin_0960 [Desulfurispirillum indicum S5]|uniref:Uncharacterized protein n=1 Tax=Desulfurispirillum indicum (strain ATCC BAA-1389 / DSM 22839 / S5) TaxID=653733 RepID=E6W337_DESIS|nr:hypothetical protein Selin_0960 [Desulfurispirillum indicum S5]